ncbi:hypothetical protein HDV03_005273 [Kappamyces sp. JEL0829]|nr:hypothetical protein HDV03_005273 [Kappamyces sp. JEL0829]
MISIKKFPIFCARNSTKFLAAQRFSTEPSNASEQMGMRHFKSPQNDFWTNPVNHEVWSQDEVLGVKETHRDPKGWEDKVALFTVKALRWSFDTFSGYRFGTLTEGKVLNRAIFLETVAGCPGMAGGMIRHLHSLRKMRRDYGWIHTLLEEAENERMHLLTFIKLKQPGWIFRSMVLLTQGIFMNGFFFAYLINPRICHRFVGYLEEEAVHTYGSILEAIEDGRLGEWKTKPAPEIAMEYWRLKDDATMKDLILAVRADESNHRDVNHTFANLAPDSRNPFLKHK